MEKKVLVVDDFTDLVRVICNARDEILIDFLEKKIEGVFCEKPRLAFKMDGADEYSCGGQVLCFIADLVSQHKEFALVSFSENGHKKTILWRIREKIEEAA